MDGGSTHRKDPDGYTGAPPGKYKSARDPDRDAPNASDALGQPAQFPLTLSTGSATEAGEHPSGAVFPDNEAGDPPRREGQQDKVQAESTGMPLTAPSVLSARAKSGREIK